ncbi:unnamed protein product [Rotaria sp. Silwood2]|nr:unnamed protein product [Rotaria sp. Silwood2]CAF4613563.1 unnamed protein product [Rotaria sp. Silwood2]
MVIADCSNHRIVQWKIGDTNIQVVAGGNGEGNRLSQLKHPTDVLIDKQTYNLIICDAGNRRIVRWSRRRGTKTGEILISNVDCRGLAMDDQRNLYVSDAENHAVRRYQINDEKGVFVAGGNGFGTSLNQLAFPTYVFVDRQQTLYISDSSNNRVMKWPKGATEGIVVVGVQENENALHQLSGPAGVFVDNLGILYIADSHNHRVLRRRQDTQVTVIVGGNGHGSAANQLNCPVGLSFDRQGNLYVVDNENNRVQRFSIE